MSWRKLRVSSTSLEHLLLGQEAYESNLPKDVRIRHVIWQEATNTIEIFLESPTWLDLPDGQLFPEIVPTFRRLNVPTPPDDLNDWPKA